MATSPSRIVNNINEVDELVSVLVPRRFLAQVYGLVAKLDAEGGSILAQEKRAAELGDGSSSQKAT